MNLWSRDCKPYMDWTVDDRYMDAEGKFDLEKAGLVAYSHGVYHALGEKLGTFGFSVKK